ncbi:MAG: alpha/beta fold hydrolase [Stackebrandtia sp.]
MLTRRKTLLVAAIGVAVTAGTVPFVATADPDDKGTADWGDCADNDVVEETDPSEVPKAMKCSAIEVPIDWDAPDNTVEVQISKLPYTGDGEPKGSVIVVPGGPGGAGTSDLIGATGTFKNLREHFDVVGFDPRGHWQDKNLPMEDCTENGPEFAAPKSREEFDEIHAEQRAAIEKCRSHNPQLFDSFNSLTQAKDLDAVREAVGDEKLTAHATSYGGVIAQAYARTFPERVRTLYMDGTVSHDRELPAAEERYYAKFEDLFGRFVTWCESNADCALSGEDIPDVWQRLIKDADEEPIPVSELDGVSYNGHDLQNNVAAFLNYDEKWPDLARGIVEAREGDASILAGPSLVYNGKAFAAPPGVAVECGDGLGYDSYADYEAGRERGKRLSPNFPENRVNRAMFCIDFDAPVSNPPGPIPGDELPPILGVAAANEDHVQDITDQVPGSRLLRYEGYGHGLYLKGNQCVIEHADRYLLDGTLPDEGVSCPKELSPVHRFIHRGCG